ncbi:MAG: hypothetical protein LRY68_12155 [Sulfurospirillum sp.]|nr:hypothetical protein [Sulfurospirillum sp.]
MERFRDILKASNLKSTHQRLAILECIDTHGHIDIETLFELILQNIQPCLKPRCTEILMIYLHFIF